MHSKRLGNLGELKVATYLVSYGYSVFLELGDISKIDLIVEYESKLLGIQVKAISRIDDCYRFKSSKSGPNYQFKYTEEDCDIFAVYCIEDDQIIWLTSKEATEQSNLTFRTQPPKNNQENKIRYLADYTDVTRVLRGHEQDSLTGNAEANDMVQTTTTEKSADENQSSR